MTNIKSFLFQIVQLSSNFNKAGSVVTVTVRGLESTIKTLQSPGLLWYYGRGAAVWNEVGRDNFVLGAIRGFQRSHQISILGPWVEKGINATLFTLWTKNFARSVFSEGNLGVGIPHKDYLFKLRPQ